MAVLIGVGSLMYTNWLTRKIEQEERNKVELWAKATEHISNGQNLDSEYLNFLLEITSKNTTIPLIIVNKDGSINSDANINYAPGRREQVLKRELEKMKEHAQPIRIQLSAHQYQLLYYRESSILRNLRLFPIVQLVVILIFITVAYFAVNATNKAEQNQVWVGMSKETAHQLGTPISSLMAWIEILKLKDIDPALITELEHDTRRLERITERFSKIGSKPELLLTNLPEVISSTVDYLKKRTSSKVEFKLEFDRQANIEVPLNEALFSWVIENICKNAVDAMGKEGCITISIGENTEQTFVDISDNGCGISKSNHKTIFQPGYSTKKRGWGLGLSLAKRIIEMYHKGKIFIKWSEPGKGTTFRIVLNKHVDSK